MVKAKCSGQTVPFTKETGDIIRLVVKESSLTPTVTFITAFGQITKRMAKESIQM